MCRRKGKSSSLAWKFGFLTGTEVAVAIISVLIFYMAQDWRSARNHLIDNGTHVAALMARECESSAGPTSPEKMQWSLSGIDNLASVSYAFILDAKGAVMAERFKIPRKDVPGFTLTSAMRGDAAVKIREFRAAIRRVQFIDIIVPFGGGSKGQAGYIRLGLSQSYLDIYHPRVTWPGIAFCLFIWASMIAITYFASRKISSPVKALQRVAREISAGNLGSTVEIKSNDEISDYSRAFNAILGRFEEYRAKAEEDTETVLAAKARLEHFLLSSPGVIFSCRPDRPWDTTFVSDGIRALLGTTPEQTVNNPGGWLELVHPADKSDLFDRLERLPSICSDISEYRLKHANGEYVWIRDEMRVQFDEDGRPKEFIGYWVDITSYKALEEKLIFDAFHDSLTKLPNRSLFLDRLNVSFARSRRHSSSLFALLFLDIDHFKNINDTMGHEAGDLVLQTIAMRLLTCVRFGDTVARWGGDEFAIIVQDIKSVEEAEAVAGRLLAAFDQPFLIQDSKKFVTGSVGATVASSSYRHPEHLLRDADIAMYQAKKDGRAKAVLFRESMRETALARRKLESDLRHAMENEEFSVHYQPIINALSERPVGLEALLRWNHPTAGTVMPGDFIPLAEESGLIVPIGSWILRESCSRLRSWNERKIPREQAFISVNISGRQLIPSFIEDVRQSLEANRLDPSSLVLEITESSVMEDFERAAGIMRQLKRMNVRVFIDDFGTGYSSMRYLHRLPVTGLKIDRSFVAALSPNNEIFEIVRSIVQLAGKLNLAVIAEGVEKQAQLDCLRDMGCGLVQGSYFGRPMNEAKTEEYLKTEPVD